MQDTSLFNLTYRLYFQITLTSVQLKYRRNQPTGWMNIQKNKLAVKDKDEQGTGLYLKPSVR